ncbi:hypothetical protein V8E36_001799 [Tilletia maclaganii]
MRLPQALQSSNQVRRIVSASTPGAGTSAAAARLASCFGKLGSVSYGKDRNTAGAGATTTTPTANASTSSACVNPVGFRQGITLIKDRRLIDRSFFNKHQAKIFESIVEKERLRVRPVIDKTASARTATNIINEAFKGQGHDLIRDGWSGFEFGYVTNTDHRRMTLGPESNPKQMLSGAELASGYGRWECFIIVCSDKKFKPYDPPFFELFSNVFSDDETEAASVTGKGKEKAVYEPEFKKCIHCSKHFSIDVHHEHEESCMVSRPMSRLKNVDDELCDLLASVKKEPAAASEHNSGSGSEEDDCFCGRPNTSEKTMIGCENLLCNTWRHKSCADAAGFCGKDWYCPDCRLPTVHNDQGAGQGSTSSIEAQGKKRKANFTGEKRTSSRTRSGRTR